MGTSLGIRLAPATRLWKNPGDLTNNQRTQLDWIAKTDPPTTPRYLLKEGLRFVFAIKGDEGKVALDRRLSWARRSRMQSFVELARKLTKRRAVIRPRTRLGPLQRPHRVHQRQDPTPHPHRVRVPRTPNPSSPSPCSPSGATHPVLPGRT